MLVELFYHTDEFCKLLNSTKISDKSPNMSIQSSLTSSEIMTICVYYHFSGYKTFKDYYIKGVLRYNQKDFKKLVSYSRFIELKQELALDLGLFAMLLCHLNKCTGTSFIDSTPLVVCHNRRIYSHKVFKGLAARGKTSTGWFFGFKLHIVIDQNGNILNFHFTPGNVSDANAETLTSLLTDLFGNIYGDKGYLLNQKLFEYFYENGLHMITKIRSNMDNKLMALSDKLLLSKRGMVESVIDILKIHLSIDHTRHRSSRAFLANLFSGLVAYAFYPTKPSITSKFWAIS